MFDLLKDIFKKKEKPMPEQVKVADKNLPLNIKNMSVADLAAKINKINKPNKWAITRFAASGKLDKKYVVGGNHYQQGYTSKQREEKIKRQIEKGIIQSNEAQIEERFKLREERIARQLEKQTPQGVVNEGDGKVL